MAKIVHPVTPWYPRRVYSLILTATETRATASLGLYNMLGPKHDTDVARYTWEAATLLALPYESLARQALVVTEMMDRLLDVTRDTVLVDWRADDRSDAKRLGVPSGDHRGGLK